MEEGGRASWNMKIFDQTHLLQHQPAGGKITSSIPPGLELRQTRPIAEGTILVQGTIPDQQNRRTRLQPTWGCGRHHQWLHRCCRQTCATLGKSQLFHHGSSSCESCIDSVELKSIQDSMGVVLSSTCRTLQAHHCGSTSYSASPPFHSWWWTEFLIMIVYKC